MSIIDDCKSESPVTREWLEGQLQRGRGCTPEVARKLAGMVARGEGFKSTPMPVMRTEELPADDPEDDPPKPMTLDKVMGKLGLGSKKD